MVTINIGRKEAIFFGAIILTFLAVGMAVAFGGSEPEIMGHSLGEIAPPTGCSAGQALIWNGEGWGCGNAGGGSTLSGSESLSFEVYHSDTSTYACVEKDLEDYCGDEDGCTIRLLMLHETDNDKVRIIEGQVYMEQPSLSNNRGAGLYGWTRLDGADYGWIAGSTGQYDIASPWEWMWIKNYKHGWCEGQNGNGPAFSNPYQFSFMSHPHVRTNVIVYD